MTPAEKANEHLGLISQETEKAADSIIGLCEKLQSQLRGMDVSSDTKTAMQDTISSIIQTCSFQDIVSQRSKIVGEIVQSSNVSVEQQNVSYENSLKEGPATQERPPLSQEEIDNMLD